MSTCEYAAGCTAPADTWLRGKWWCGKHGRELYDGAATPTTACGLKGCYVAVPLPCPDVVPVCGKCRADGRRPTEESVKPFYLSAFLNPAPANDTPVGGRHYHRGSEPQCWDRVWSIGGPAFFVGSVESYVERYRLKGGVADLEKARHYLQKLIELERAYAAGTGPAPGIFGKPGETLDPLPPEKL